MDNAVQRIIDAHASRLAALPPEAVDVLDAELPARAVSDEALLQLGDNFSLLYFARPDYEHAVWGLSREEIRAALATRSEAWSPEAASHAIPWLTEQLHGCLTLTALALREAHDSATVAALQDNFTHTLQRLATLAGDPPLGLLLPSEVVEIALQGESRLVMEYGELPMPDGQTHMERHHLRCAALARIMADLGDDAFLDGPPFVSRSRGVNVTWLDPEVRAELTREGDTVTDWRGGTVIPWPNGELHRLAAPQEGEIPISVDVLYLDADQYEAFASSTTPAQQERDFAARLAAARAPNGAGIGESVVDHVHRLEIEQLAYLWGLRDLFAGLGHAALVAQVEPLIRDEIPRLMAALQCTPSGLPTSEEDTVLGRLLAAERFVDESADLFARLTPPDWIELRPEWEEFLATGTKLGELTKLRRPT